MALRGPSPLAAFPSTFTAGRALPAGQLCGALM
jgi:hypothetical protein